MSFNVSVFITNMVDNNIHNPCKQKPFGFSVSICFTYIVFLKSKKYGLEQMVQSDK